MRPRLFARRARTRTVAGRPPGVAPDSREGRQAGDAAGAVAAQGAAGIGPRLAERRRRRKARRAARRTWFGRHPKTTVLAALLIAMTPVWWSLGSALTNPMLGTSLAGRLAEWVRDHGGRSFVVWGEDLWYSHHKPPIGGKPPKGAIPAPTKTTTAPHATAAPVAPHLPPPAPIAPIASPPIPGEGQWHPAGRLVHGMPAVYEAFVRPDAVHTSLVAGVAWMDTKLLAATLYPGTYVPGGGPYAHQAPVPPGAATNLVAAFNGGFRMKDAIGGYYTDGRTVAPLVDGEASFVIYRDGTATVADWGRDAVMGPNVVAVRQNVAMLVDGGQPGPAVASGNQALWGWTLGGGDYVWRSGVGVTADGALVYAAGPNLTISMLADLLVRAGAIRAMELDINPDWVNFATYDPPVPGGLASGANGTELLAAMAGGPGRYFEPWWARDFFTMSAR